MDMTSWLVIKTTEKYSCKFRSSNHCSSQDFARAPAQLISRNNGLEAASNYDLASNKIDMAESFNISLETTFW